MRLHIWIISSLLTLSLLAGCGSPQLFTANVKIELDRQQKSSNPVALMFFFVKDIKKAEEIVRKNPEQLNDEYNKNTATTPPEGIKLEGSKIDYYNIDDQDLAVAIGTFSFVAGGPESAAELENNYDFSYDESYKRILVCYFPDFADDKPEDYKVYVIPEGCNKVSIKCSYRKVEIETEQP